MSRRQRHLWLSELPPELVIMIVKACPLMEQICIAHTCQSVHRLVCPLYMNSWNNATNNQRATVLGELRISWCVLESYVCATCCQLHRIDRHDVPVLSKAQSRTRSCGPTYIVNSWNYLYRLQHHHVQTAMIWEESSRGANKKDTKKLKKLLRPFEMKTCIEHGTLVSIAITPYCQSQRFFLHIRWTFELSSASEEG